MAETPAGMTSPSDEPRPESIEQALGQVLYRRRLALGLQQEDLAREAHISWQAISRYERGLRLPKLHQLFLLAVGLQTTPDELLSAARKLNPSLFGPDALIATAESEPVVSRDGVPSRGRPRVSRPRRQPPTA